MSKFVALMYHNLDASPRHEYAIRPEDFQAQLNWLRDHEYRAEGFDGLAQRLAGGGPWPERYAILTFDDGHQSNLEAAERIREAGFQATFFITREGCRLADFLDEAGIRELSGLCGIGSHCLTHRSLLGMPVGEAESEMQGSKHWLEDTLGRPILDLSAPGGDINRHLVERALAFGYRLVGNSREWWNDPSRPSPGTIHRTMVFRRYRLRHFESLATCSPSFFLKRRARYEATFLLKRIIPESWWPIAAKLKRTITR